MEQNGLVGVPDVVLEQAMSYVGGKVVDVVLARAAKVAARVRDKLRGRVVLLDERTTYRAFEEAVLTDDPVIAEYLAGVIAGGNGTDDGVSAVAQIARLSALQLRLHYVIYRQLWMMEARSPSGEGLRTHAEMRPSLEMLLALDDLPSALDLPVVDGDKGPAVRSMLSVLHVLAREDLIGADLLTGEMGPSTNGYTILEPWALSEKRPLEFPVAGLLCSPTPSGIELFLRGCGNEFHDPSYIRDLSADLVQAPVPAVRGFALRDLPVRPLGS